MQFKKAEKSRSLRGYFQVTFSIFRRESENETLSQLSTKLKQIKENESDKYNSVVKA